jgi:hypothetical protein
MSHLSAEERMLEKALKASVERKKQASLRESKPKNVPKPK